MWIFLLFLVKPNDVIEIQESSKKNPTVLHATEATAHSPSPNWLEVDRENLQGPRARHSPSAKTWCRSS